jgi:hypothetical protein
MLMTAKKLGAFTASVAVALAAATTIATASDHERRHEREHEEHERGPSSGIASPEDMGARALYRKECGACHLDFPPGLLTAASHRRVLAGLERHFGQNAELEADVRDRLEAWLIARSAESGSDRRSRKILTSTSPADAPLRITEGAWFQRKHRKAGPGVVARPSIRTFANCGACHPGARDWDFDDDRVKIPAE